MLGYHVINPMNGFPAFAFRLHQFISRGDTVYSSLDNSTNRHITVQKQQFVPNEERKRILLPLVFCRHCGHEFYSVAKYLDTDKGCFKYTPRDMSNRILGDEGEAGYLYWSETKPWPEDPLEIPDRLPDDWRDAEGKILTARKKIFR